MTRSDLPSSCPASIEARFRRLERDPSTVGAAELLALRAHLDACAPCRGRFGRRLVHLEGRRALRKREAPEALFDDFFEGVRDRLGQAPVGGGLSPAFLDAPRALRVWRGAAVAAMLLLGLGAGYVANAPDPALVPQAERRMERVPEGLLAPWQGARLVRPASVPDPSLQYFDLAPPPPAPVDGARVEESSRHGWD